MSSRSCISFCVLQLVVLLLLSLAVCSCKARPIAIGVVKKQLEVPSPSSHFSTKAEEEASHARVSVSNARPSNENMTNAAKKREPESGWKLEHHQEHDERNEVSGVAEKRIKSESETKSVSWKVPHPKARERQPGFNLDYDPPQTHPPVHN